MLHCLWSVKILYCLLMLMLHDIMRVPHLKLGYFMHCPYLNDSFVLSLCSGTKGISNNWWCFYFRLSALFRNHAALSTGWSYYSLLTMIIIVKILKCSVVQWAHLKWCSLVMACSLHFWDCFFLLLTKTEQHWAITFMWLGKGVSETEQ